MVHYTNTNSSHDNRNYEKRTYKKMYRFKIRNLTMDLPKPTQESFDKLFDTMFLSVFINEEFKQRIKADLQILINTKTYEIIEGENERLR